MIAVVCCVTGHGVANMDFIQVSTVPDAKSAYVNNFDFPLTTTKTPGEFEDIGATKVYALPSHGSMYAFTIFCPLA